MSHSNSDENAPGEEEKYPLIRVRGLLFQEPFMDLQRIEDVMDFKPDPTDIFVVTYPKCGTTWTQYLLWSIVNKGAPPPTPNQMMFRDFPFLEMTGLEILDSLPRPRLMKTHLTFDLQPYHPSAKYIYVVRNPWDCCVSYYHFHQMDSAMPNFTFDHYFRQFTSGQVGWGDFFDHVLSWYKHRNEPNLLILRYEEMKDNPRRTLLTIAEFLGENYLSALQADENMIENCLKHSDFKYLKNMGLFFPKGEAPKTNDSEQLKESRNIVCELGDLSKSSINLDKYEEVDFFRKGIVGDWRNHFSSEHLGIFDKYMSDKLENTELIDFWKR